MFLTAFNLPKAVYIATAGTIAIFIDTTRLTKYLAEGIRLESFALWTMPIFIVASFIGAHIAKRIVDKISQKHFRAIVGIFLLLVALKLFLWPAKRYFNVPILEGLLLRTEVPTHLADDQQEQENQR